MTKACSGLLFFLLAGCAADGANAPQARYLSPGTTPLCLAFCVVTVTNTEAAQFPVLRQAGEVTGNSKTTSTTTTTTSP